MISPIERFSGVAASLIARAASSNVPCTCAPAVCPACEQGDHEGAELQGYHAAFKCACACNQEGR